MPATRYVLSLRRDEKGGPVTSPLLYEVTSDPGIPTDGIDTFDAQLRRGILRRIDHERSNPLLRFGRVCFIMHGFNTSRSRGMWSGEELGRQPLNYDCVVAVLWPGDSWVPLVGGGVYPWVLPDAKDAGRRLGAFIARLDARAEISLVTHSFGVRVALSAVAALIGAAPGRRMQQAVFMASAADETVLEWREYKDALLAFDRVLVLSSVEDSTLRDLYPIGDFVEDQFSRNERGKHRALGRYGPLRREISALNQKLEHVEVIRTYEQDHNDYTPWPWDIPGGGWQRKRERIRDVLVERSNSQPLSDPGMLRPSERFGAIPD